MYRRDGYLAAVDVCVMLPVEYTDDKDDEGNEEKESM